MKKDFAFLQHGIHEFDMRLDDMNIVVNIGFGNLGWRKERPNHDEEYWYQCYGRQAACNRVENYNKCNPH